MSIADDLEKIALQERTLQYVRFDHETAWRLGSALRAMSVARGHIVVIDVRRFGQQLSSYAIGLALDQKQSNITEKYALPAADYVTHGGSFPIAVAGAGVIGAVTVSGLVQRADHELVVEALCAELGLSYEELKLAP